MTQDQVLLRILAALIVTSMLLLAWIPIRQRRRRRAGGAGAPDDRRAAAAIEAFVARTSADPAGGSPPEPWQAVESVGAGIAGPPTEPTVSPARPEERPSPDAGMARIELADPGTWARTIREESARVARFGHPATVVMAGLPQLDVVVDRFGREVADRVAGETARLLVSEGRAADRIVRLGSARFAILLRETDAVAARGYVERVRAVTDAWLESAGLSIRLSLGWASAPESGDVAAAARVAEQGMHGAARTRVDHDEMLRASRSIP